MSFVDHVKIFDLKMEQFLKDWKTTAESLVGPGIIDQQPKKIETKKYRQSRSPTPKPPKRNTKRSRSPPRRSSPPPRKVVKKSRSPSPLPNSYMDEVTRSKGVFVKYQYDKAKGDWYWWTKRDIYSTLSEYGTITKIAIAERKGFGMIEFDTLEQKEKCLDDKDEIAKTTYITVDIIEEKKKK